MKRIIISAVLAIALFTTPAMAKEGVYLGFDLGLNNMVGSGDWFDTVDNAVGLGFKFGYNFGQVALEGELIGSSHDDDVPGFSDGDFSGFSVNLKAYLTQPRDPNQFYFLVGLGAYGFEQTDQFTAENFEFSGSGMNLGMGLEHFFNNHVALNVAGIYRIIRYDDVEINGVTFDANDPLIDGENGDVFSLNLGLNFYF
jgi:hypothetical protein